jgi:hypothetical protein
LPDPVASHWSAGGAPDAYAPIWSLALIQLGLVAIGLGIAGLFREEGRPSAEATAMVGLLGGVGVAAMTITVVLNWGVESWEQARSFSWAYILLILAAAGLFGYAGYRLGRAWYPPIVRPQVPAPALAIADDESVSWTGTCSVRYPYLIIGGLLVLALVFPGWLLLAVAIGVLLALFLSHVRVVVNDLGMRVRLAGMPVRRIGLEDMESTAAIDLEPAQWGGWGYRMAPGRTAVVLRAGDAIEVLLTTGRRFAVTVDDAATGAAVLNGLIARRARAG